jgi:hypothetical protein
MLATEPHPGRPRIHPIAMVRVKLCACRMTEPLKAVTYDGGLTWEVIERDPVFRGCVLGKNDVLVLKGAGA